MTKATAAFQQLDVYPDRDTMTVEVTFCLAGTAEESVVVLAADGSVLSAEGASANTLEGQAFALHCAQTDCCGFSALSR